MLGCTGDIQGYLQCPKTGISDTHLIEFFKGRILLLPLLKMVLCILSLRHELVKGLMVPMYVLVLRYA